MDSNIPEVGEYSDNTSNKLPAPIAVTPVVPPIANTTVVVPPVPINVNLPVAVDTPVPDMYLIEELRRSPRLLKPVYEVTLDNTRIINVYKVGLDEVLQDPDKVTALNKEIRDLIGNGKARIVDRPKNQKVIGSTAAVKLKTAATKDQPALWKWRVAPWGFQQVEGIQYDKDKISAGTPMLQSILAFSCIVVQRRMNEVQMDVSSAFSLVELKESVHMELPIGMTQPAGEDKVLLLVNSLNGLKQSSFN